MINIRKGKRGAIIARNDQPGAPRLKHYRLPPYGSGGWMQHVYFIGPLTFIVRTNRRFV